MRNASRAILLAALTATAAPSLALTDAEVAAKLDAYEQRIAELEAALAKPGSVPTQDMASELDRLAARVDKVDRKGRKRVSRLSDRLDEAQSRLKVQGFGSAGVAVLDDSDAVYQAISNKPSYAADGIIGTQFNFRVSDEVDFVAQLVARGNDEDLSFNQITDWAYVSWQATDTLKLRAGRMRIPFYQLSDYLEVGYVYPWARPVREVYSLTALDRYSGIDALYNWNAGNLSGLVQVFAGRGFGEFNGLDIDIDELVGFNASVSWQNWTARVGYVASALDVTPQDDDAVALSGLLGNFGLESFGPNPDANFKSIGLQYDNGSLWGLAEATRLESDGPLPDIDSWYVSAGYRFGRVMPYAYYADYETKDDDERTATANVLRTVSGGLQAQAAGLAPTIGALEAGIAALEPIVASFTDPTTGQLAAPSVAALNAVLNLEGLRANLAAANAGVATLNSNATSINAAAIGFEGLNTSQSTLAFGFRFDATTNTAVKLQYERISDIEGTILVDNHDGDDLGVFSLVIDTVF